MRSGLLGLALAAALTGSTAFGESSGDALISEGLELRRQGQDERARECFERALSMEPSPRAHAQLALAEQALGHWVTAERELLAALQSKQDRWVSEKQVLLEESLATIEQHLGTLQVESNVGGELRINHETRGKLPIGPLRVEAGRILIELIDVNRSPGLKQELDIAAGTTQVLHFEMTTAPLPPPLAAETSKVLDVKGPASAARSRSRGVEQVVGWSLVGAGAISLSAGLGMQLMRQRAVAHYNDDDLCVRPGLTRDQVCGGYRARADTTQTLTYVGYAGAGIFAAGAVVALLVLPATRSRSQPHASIVPMLGGVMVTCGGSL